LLRHSGDDIRNKCLHLASDILPNETGFANREELPECKLAGRDKPAHVTSAAAARHNVTDQLPQRASERAEHSATHGNLAITEINDKARASPTTDRFTHAAHFTHQQHL